MPFIVGAGPPDLFVGTPLASVSGYEGLARAAGAVAIAAAHTPATIIPRNRIYAGYALKAASHSDHGPTGIPARPHLVDHADHVLDIDIV
jgi:hypothetical protein